MKFTITIEVPDGVRVTVQEEALGNLLIPSQSIEAQYVPPFADELIPLPDAIPLPGDPVPFRGMAQNAPQGAECPVHHVQWKEVPAGVSKKTGKPYTSFRVCSVQGCDQRPAA